MSLHRAHRSRKIRLGRLAIGLLGIVWMLVGCGGDGAAPAESGVVYVTVTPAPLTTPLDRPDSDLEEALLAGSWGGEFQLDDQSGWVLVVADFSLEGVGEAAGFAVQLSFPLDEPHPIVSSQVRFELAEATTRVLFEIPFQRENETVQLAFDGAWQGDKIVGAVRRGDVGGTFELAPISDFAPDVFEGRT